MRGSPRWGHEMARTSKRASKACRRWRRLNQRAIRETRNCFSRSTEAAGMDGSTPAVDRTSTKTSVAPSSATMSSSPKGQEALRAMIVQPWRRNHLQARRSARVPHHRRHHGRRGWTSPHDGPDINPWRRNSSACAHAGGWPCRRACAGNTTWPDEQRRCDGHQSWRSAGCGAGKRAPHLRLARYGER